MEQDVILLNLTTSMWGVSRALAESDYEVDANKKMTRANKKILDCAEYDYLNKLKNGVHRTLRLISLPAHFMKAGIYPLSVALIEQVDKVLEEFMIRWQVGVDGLGSVWSFRVAEAAEDLGGLYNEADYPEWEQVKRQFYVRWNYMEASTPGILKKVSPQIYSREQQKLAEEKAAMMAEIRQGLRLSFQQVLDGLVSSLTPAADGTRRRLSGFEPALKFIDTFLGQKNVTDDDDMEALVKETRGLLVGQDVSKLRKDESLRDVVAERLGNVKQLLDGMVEDAPRELYLRD